MLVASAALLLVQPPPELIEQAIRTLKTNILGEASAYMQTTSWRVREAGLEDVPSQWSDLVPWLNGTRDYPERQHWETWAAGRFAGICVAAPRQGRLFTTVGEYYDGNVTLKLYYDGSSAALSGLGYSTAGVRLWPHHFLGVVGANGLAPLLEAAWTDNRLQSTGSDRQFVLSYNDGDTYSVEVRVGLDPNVHISEFLLASPDGGQWIRTTITEWQDQQRRWPSQAQVTYPLTNHDSGSDGGSDATKAALGNKGDHRNASSDSLDQAQVNGVFINDMAEETVSSSGEKQKLVAGFIVCEYPLLSGDEKEVLRLPYSVTVVE